MENSEQTEKELRRLQGLINKAVSYRQQTRDKEYINNQAHYEGLQWNLAQTDESPFIVKSDINHLKNAVDIRFGSLYANTYYGDLKPLSPNDVETVEDLSLAYRNEWFRLNLDQITEDIIKAAGIFDNGYLKFNFDTDAIRGGTNTRRQGLITAKQVSTLNIYLDPSADSISDCDFMIETWNPTMETIKRDYPDWYSKLKKANIQGEAAKDQNTGSILTGRSYTTSQDNIVPIKIVYEKVKKDVEVPIVEGLTDEVLAQLPEEERAKLVEKIKVTRVKWTYVCKDIILDTNEDYSFDEFPTIPMQWSKIPQSPYGMPLLRGLTIPQKVANLIESAVNNIVVKYTVPTWLVSDDSGLDVDEVAKLINAVGVVWKVTNVEGAIRQLEPPEIKADIIQMGNNFVGYIKEYAGATNVYTGDIGTAGSTSQGTIEAIGRATIIDNDPIKQITDFVERASRLLIKFMGRYYAGDTMFIRQDNAEGGYDFKSIEMTSKIANVNFDFDVDLGSRSKNDKNRQYNLMKDIYQLQNQYKDPNPVINVPDIIKAAQLDNYNEMKNRFDKVSEEAMNEKVNLITQLVQISNTTLPNGEPLIDAQTLQDGILDVINDDNDLSTVQGIIQTYEQYQTAVTDFKSQQTMLPMGGGQIM